MKEKYQIKMNLYTDWLNFLKTRLQEMKCPVSEVDTPEQISLGYFNLLKRRISPQPRKIIISREFFCPLEHLKGLENIKAKIEQGKDLWPHLSKKIAKLEENDALLNDWGIHHLHLGTSLEEAKGFTKRTGAVLFARFTDEAAFLIKIMEHGKDALHEPWTNHELIHVLPKNWPDSISQFQVRGVQVPQEYANDDIKNFCKNGISTYSSVEGAVYLLIGGGHSISGINGDARIQTNIHVRTIEDLEKYIRGNYLQLMGLIEQKGITSKAKLRFRLVIDDSKVEILEEYSRKTWSTQLEFKDGMLKDKHKTPFLG